MARESVGARCPTCERRARFGVAAYRHATRIRHWICAACGAVWVVTIGPEKDGHPVKVEPFKAGG